MVSGRSRHKDRMARARTRLPICNDGGIEALQRQCKLLSASADTLCRQMLRRALTGATTCTNAHSPSIYIAFVLHGHVKDQDLQSGQHSATGGVLVHLRLLAARAKHAVVGELVRRVHLRQGACCCKRTGARLSSLHVRLLVRAKEVHGGSSFQFSQGPGSQAT